MKRLVIAAAITAAVAVAGAVGWQAGAATPAAPVPAAGAYTPIHPAACSGRDVHCGPGSHWVCGPEGKRCWCAAC